MFIVIVFNYLLEWDERPLSEASLCVFNRRNGWTALYFVFKGGEAGICMFKMETSTSTTAGKKEGKGALLEGNGFTDTGKKATPLAAAAAAAAAVAQGGTFLFPILWKQQGPSFMSLLEFNMNKVMCPCVNMLSLLGLLLSEIYKAGNWQFADHVPSRNRNFTQATCGLKLGNNKLLTWY